MATAPHHTGSLIRLLGNGAIEGAEMTTRETAEWLPSFRSADAIINPVKDLADARGRDSDRNDGYVHGAVAVNKDGIVGSQYILNAQPDISFLATLNKGFDQVWADEFKEVMETRFGLLSESSDCWLDAAGMNTLTGMVRLAIGIFVLSGEYLGTVEWLRDPGRPFSTAIQTVAPDRLSNPYGVIDTRNLRRGIEKDDRGRPLFYNIRQGNRFDMYPDNLAYTWARVPAAKPWGRKQVIHIVEQASADQSRGLSDIVAALKRVRMLRKFSDVALQSAVVNATYAATIESDLDPRAIELALGGGTDPVAALLRLYAAHMGATGAYLGEANNVRIDGAMIPHLPPNSKLNMTPVKASTALGTEFEQSCLRNIAAPLGVSYEALSRDFSKTNYSSARAALGIQGQFMKSRKKHVADRLASDIFALVLEEDMAAGNVPLPAGASRDLFYAPLSKEAFTQCEWIGSGAGQIDEQRETEAAAMKIRAGMSTHAIECARLGLSWRKVYAQLSREQKEAETLGLYLDYSTRGTPNVPPESQDAPAAAAPAPASAP